MCADLPTDQFPQSSVPARVAHQLIKDELALDGNPKMNVSTVVDHPLSGTILFYLLTLSYVCSCAVVGVFCHDVHGTGS